MIKYIDFDDVVVATEDLLFIEYNKLKLQGIEVDKINIYNNLIGMICYVTVK